MDILVNKAAYFEYFVEEKYEAGIALSGNEVKSLRQKNASFADSFCFFENNELMLKNMQIGRYKHANSFEEHDARRSRKLLMRKIELRRLHSKVKEKGYTLVPLKLYFKQALVKVEVGLCKGKNLVDKKNVQKEKDLLRLAERQIRGDDKWK